MSSLHFRCHHRYASGFELAAEFDAGEGVTALFGPSGSGKSTILAMIAGTLSPATGTIRLRDRVLFDSAARTSLPPERRRLGVVFQDHLLFPHLSVAANLRYGMRRSPACPIHIERVVEILELGSLLDRYPQTLSGGERQRTALGRALLCGPELLLMDEPLAALDEELKERILAYLERAFDEWRIPTLFVSHQQADVRRLAADVVVLEAGRVLDSGPVATTLDRAVMTEMKSRPGPVNLLRVDGLRQIHGHWEGRVGQERIHLPGAMPLAGNSVYVQFLPSDVTLGRGDVQGLSVRNQLHGRVREIVALPGRAYVGIDIGQLIWAEVTPEAVRELDLRPETPVTCLIKTSAVQPVG